MSRFLPGLVSVTFRALSPTEVIRLAADANLKTVEWGADVHVPPGKIMHAREVSRQAREAGLACAAYGSYYRLGGKEDATPFEPVLETALALGAPTIRVWAGSRGSADMTPESRKRIIGEAARVGSLAQAQGVTISLEYHSGTLTDTRDSVLSLLREIPDTSVEFLWQPATGETLAQNVERLRDVLPRVRHLHVFHWWPEVADRLPLAEGEERWKSYLQILRETRRDIPCLLEFVRNDSPEQFLRDAATLRRWLSEMA